MTKKPKEIRYPKKNENDYAIPTHKYKCNICGEDYRCVIRSIHLCENCAESFCDHCSKVKPFITVRRDSQNPNDHEQLCSDCYMNACNAIILLDKMYGKKDISDHNKDIYGDEN